MAAGGKEDWGLATGCGREMLPPLSGVPDGFRMFVTAASDDVDFTMGSGCGPAEAALDAAFAAGRSSGCGGRNGCNTTWPLATGSLSGMVLAGDCIACCVACSAAWSTGTVALAFTGSMRAAVNAGPFPSIERIRASASCFETAGEVVTDGPAALVAGGKGSVGCVSGMADAKIALIRFRKTGVTGAGVPGGAGVGKNAASAPRECPVVAIESTR